ncbi:MAG: DEAD/DEAH box helicase family protein, partial [Candidatus Marinimicrobia bacterium]|nr:DEAD/DEAH box helicase family protein [Candidatus Neomarinimicrobiota bacterium]
MFAEVALSISTFQSFTYKIPSDLIHIARVGSRAKVQLGNRLVYGVITSINKNTTYEGDIKPVSDIIEDGPVLTKELWELIYWISYYYVTPIGKVFNTVLPISISNNYSPQLNWYAKYNELKNRVVIGDLKKKAPKQYNVYRHIKKASPALLKVSSLKNICSNPVSICQSLEKKRLIILVKKGKEYSIDDLSFKPIEKKIRFNPDQKIVINKLNKSIETRKFNSHLLHGVTGSGKTEIFIEIIKKVIANGKSAIILLPEISLTPQIAGRFKSVFGNKTALWHSQLTKSQRASTWQKVYSNDYKIVIGA